MEMKESGVKTRDNQQQEKQKLQKLTTLKEKEDEMEDDELISA